MRNVVPPGEGGGSAFVARTEELERLGRLLETALEGQLSVCFVTGEAGSGKTALLTEFARRAAEADPDLVFAIGDCNAQAGAGDPYLPFREILGIFTGDLEGKLAAGAITEGNARRLRDRLEKSARIVAEFGPALVDVFVPGSALAAQVGARMAKKLGWQRSASDPRAESQSGTTVTWERDQIFEQFTNVLRTMSEQQPLALVIDDLHWADSGSIDLLFHLCRRLGRSRVLLIGAYRPADLALGRSGGRHPLLQVTNEVKRYFGDVWIELDQIGGDEERMVVDAMIDREPNRLGEDFRDALVARTRGHPLFTDELLRALRDRGELVRDHKGYLVEGTAISWDEVPPRVEGVIDERIGRLPEDLREILEVAAVEGEDFTAEAVAAVLDRDARDVTRLLSRSLDRDHQLVGARGVKRLGGQRLSLYRFRHNLFQVYLYDTLDEVERVQLHEGVGHALARLYANDPDEIAAQLARHAELAGETAAAIRYLRQAGERARRSYANAQARSHFEAALVLLETATEAELRDVDVDSGDSGPIEARLREGLGDVLTVIGEHETAQDTFRLASSLHPAGSSLSRARLARKIGDSLRSQNRWTDALQAFAVAETELGAEPPPADGVDSWRELVELRVGIIWARYFLGQTVEIAQLAKELRPLAEKHGTPAQRGAVSHCVILAAFRSERYAISDATLAVAQDAVDLASGVGDLLILVAAQFQLAFCHLWRDELEAAERELNASLELAERAGWAWHRILSLTYLAILYRRLGDRTRASDFTERGMEAATSADLPIYVGVAWANRSWLAWHRGELEEAQRHGQKALNLWEGRGAYPIQWTACWPLAAVALQVDDMSAAIQHARALIDPAQQKLPDALTAWLESAVGSWEANDRVAARAALERAVAHAGESGYL